MMGIIDKREMSPQLKIQIERDKDLVHRICNADEIAFSEMVNEYSEQIKILSVKILAMWGIYNIEEDVVQDTFIICYRNIRKFDSTKGTTLKAWLLGIANNLIKKQIAKRRPGISFEDLDNAGAKQLDELIKYLPAFDENIDGTKEKKLLSEAIQKLPSPLKETVEIYVELNVTSYNELSEILGIPQGTLKSRINRAVKYLSGFIEKIQTGKD